MRRALLVALLSAGCTTVTAPVVSPVASRSSTVAVSWAATWSPATAHIVRPDGTPQTLTGDAAHSWGGDDSSGVLLGAVFMPAVASWHFADAFSDGELFAGWRQIGGAVRVHLAASPNETVTSLVLSGTHQWVGAAGEGSLALEVSPRLGSRLRAILRVGFGYGRRENDVVMPDALDTTAGHDNTVGAAHLKLFRWDGRVEALVGITREHVTFSLQPYWVTFDGPVQGVSCVACVAGVELVDFAQRNGLTIALTTRY